MNPNPPDADGFVSGLSAQVVEELTDSDENAATQEDLTLQTQEILDNARREGEEIVAQAHREAEQFIEVMKNEGYDQGLKAGAEKLRTGKDSWRKNTILKWRSLIKNIRRRLLI